MHHMCLPGCLSCYVIQLQNLCQILMEFDRRNLLRKLFSHLELSLSLEYWKNVCVRTHTHLHAHITEFSNKS